MVCLFFFNQRGPIFTVFTQAILPLCCYLYPKPQKLHNLPFSKSWNQMVYIDPVLMLMNL